MSWWKRAIGIGAKAVPAVRAGQAVLEALEAAASTDDERAAVETLRPVVAEPRQHAASAIVEAVAKAQVATGRGLGVSGWRPALGWACVLILLWHYLARDLVGLVVELPPAQGELVTVLVTALGIAALRTGEKAAGLTR